MSNRKPLTITVEDNEININYIDFFDSNFTKKKNQYVDNSQNTIDKIYDLNKKINGRVSIYHTGQKYIDDVELIDKFMFNTFLISNILKANIPHTDSPVRGNYKNIDYLKLTNLQLKKYINLLEEQVNVLKEIDKRN